MINVVVEIGRLVRRLNRSTPTGVDRVLIAYLLELRRNPEFRLTCCYAVRGRLFPFTRSFADRLIDTTIERWFGEGAGRPALQRGNPSFIRAMGAIAYGWVGSALNDTWRLEPGTVFLSLDHNGLQPGEAVSRLARLDDIRIVSFLHDLIPLTHSEYVVPRSVGQHVNRATTISQHSDLVIANSAYTAQALEDFLCPRGMRHPRTVVAHLGVEQHLRPARKEHANQTLGEPYFVVIGTIEARKNHLLLLNVWRDLAQQMGPETPVLEIIGRRGWEAEAVFDMLDRCSVLSGVVHERSDVSDREMAELVAGARAMLFPSFVEGFGLPLAEALATQTPVVAADIPAFREVGGDAPDYLSPIDGLGWKEAIVDYARSDSPMRARQQARLGAFRAPTWDQHFQVVFAEIAKLC